MEPFGSTGCWYAVYRCAGALGSGLWIRGSRHLHPLFLLQVSSPIIVDNLPVLGGLDPVERFEFELLICLIRSPRKRLHETPRG